MTREDEDGKVLLTPAVNQVCYNCGKRGHMVTKVPKNLRTWGEAGTVKLRTRSHTKLDD
jgi:Zinc knuckle